MEVEQVPNVHPMQILAQDIVGVAVMRRLPEHVRGGAHRGGRCGDRENRERQHTPGAGLAVPCRRLALLPRVRGGLPRAIQHP